MLPPETKRVWDYLRAQPALSGFTLIGGSALSLRIQHRLSEDLDFAFSNTELPRLRLDALVRFAQQNGFIFKRHDSEAAVEEFVQGGMDLHNFQQDFLVNDEVKVSFFTPDESLKRVLCFDRNNAPRLASIEELFRAKCLVSARRSKTRDWIDLYLLMCKHGFTAADYDLSFEAGGIAADADLGWTRLCSDTPQKDDEGYVHLLDSAPTIQQMTEFFRARRSERERQAAARVFRNCPPK